MSAVGSPPPPDLMRTYMLRSSTPASNEKVLLYLEGMQKAPPDDDGASSVRSSKHTRSQLSRGPASIAEEDIRSDVQEMNQSEVARTIPIHTTGMPEEIPDHEPGPNDPPGPKFESYGSSFGNFGPLRDSLPPMPTNGWNNQTWVSPTKAAGVPLPETVVSPSPSFPNPFQEFGMAPLEGVNVPLPASVTSGPSRRTGQASQKAPSIGNDFLSPKSAARPMSPPRTVNGNGQSAERPWSPRSGMSHQPSRVTQKTSRSMYPPLPESTLEDPMVSRAASPPARSHHKTPSISPSESASQAPRMRAHKSTSQKEPSHKPSRSVRGTSEVNVPPPEPVRSSVSRAAPSQREAEARSQAMSPRSQASRALSQRTNDELVKAASAISAARSQKHHDPEMTPTPSRPASPLQDLNAEEQRLVNEFLTRPAGARTSYAPSAMAPSTLEPEIQHSHFHDGELCQLLHALDTPMADPVKKAIRKAVRARVKKLGMKYDNESIKQYRKSYHDHNPAIHLTGEMAAGLHQLASMDEPPEWAKNLLENVAHLTAKVDRVDTKVDKVVELRSSRAAGSFVSDGRSFPNGQHEGHYAPSESRTGYVPSPMTQSVNMPPLAQTEDEDMYTEPRHDPRAVDEEEFYDDELGHGTIHDDETREVPSEYNEQQNSPGHQRLQEELYKLRVKPHTGSQSAATHKTWEVARDDGGEFYDEGDTQAAVTESGLPEIPDTHTGNYAPTERSLPPVPRESQEEAVAQHTWPVGDFNPESRGLPPWQRIHSRLLSWAIVWPMSELENALNSTTRGHQVDEVALSIWSTQSYKRYVRSRMTESPPERVDRLFVPPNMAEAISNAVYNGRHGDACGMLRDLWAPFGLDGIPRLLIVLAKHRNDYNHWVVHRFSLPDGSLTTYDTYPEKSLPDGRPLGWWFAIRIAWPDAIYPSPDRLMQRLVRLHRPMQLAIDNSVAAAGIWRNILMASRAERSLDLERLRDLINQEVKNLRQRKVLGKLSISSPRPNWDDMH